MEIEDRWNQILRNVRFDRARIQIGRISRFFLHEMSRQRLRESSVKWKIELRDVVPLLKKLLKMIEFKSILNLKKIC